MTLLKKRPNQYYYGNSPSHDYFANLRSMGTPRVTHLTDGNGHVCEEIPLCRKPATVMLQYAHETVYLCADGYKRLQEMK